MKIKHKILLVGNKINKITGILNGTCNYILTKMENEKRDFDNILKEAMELGYAEANPTLDIEGIDTAHKAAILASLAYGEWFGMEPIYIEGIKDVSLTDINYAQELGYRTKLLAVIKNENHNVQIRVHPTLVPKESQMGNVNDVYNAIHINGTPVGNAMFYGKGAGLEATSSAVISDIVEAALDLKFGSHRRVPAFRIGKQYQQLLDMSEIESRYYIRLKVKDETGVLAKISKALLGNNINVSSILQKEKHDIGVATMIILTHGTLEKNILKAIRDIDSSDLLIDKVKYIRIEDF